MQSPKKHLGRIDRELPRKTHAEPNGTETLLGSADAPTRTLRRNLPPPKEFRLETRKISHALSFGEPAEREMKL
jgi:hypothetical protein